MLNDYLLKKPIFTASFYFCFFSKEKTPGSTGGNKKL